jgi:uncharacterized membrane protein
MGYTQDRRLEKQDAILRLLRETKGAIKQSAIAHRLSLCQATVSVVICDLERMGLIERQGNTKARVYRVLE